MRTAASTGVRGVWSLIRLIEARADVHYVGMEMGGVHRQLVFKRLVDGNKARFPVPFDISQKRTQLNLASQIRRWASGQMDGHGGRWSLPY